MTELASRTTERSWSGPVERPWLIELDRLSDEMDAVEQRIDTCVAALLPPDRWSLDG